MWRDFVSSGDNKFFFEEDTEEIISSGVSSEEQADIFGSSLEGMGVSGAPDSMEPISYEIKPMKVKEKKTNLLLIEYGVVDQDYVLHITPTHPKWNFTDNKKLRTAIETVVIILNQIVPFDLKVEIHLPKEDWEVKVISFVIRGAANAWNLELEPLDAIIEKEVDVKLASICMLP